MQPSWPPCAATGRSTESRADACAPATGVHNALHMKAGKWQLLALAGSALLVPALSLGANNNARPTGSQGSGTGGYMWVDENGQRHYGDAVPEKYSQTEQRVLNNQGVEVGRIGPPKTAAQIAAEKRAAQEATQREQHDRFLMTTYTSVHDIERLRDERMVQVQGQITAAMAYIDSLEVRLKGVQDRAMMFKPYNSSPDARRMPDDLAEELARDVNEVRAQKLGLEQRRKDAENTRAQFDADISRYNELMARGALPAATNNLH